MESAISLPLRTWLSILTRFWFRFLPPWLWRVLRAFLLSLYFVFARTSMTKFPVFTLLCLNREIFGRSKHLALFHVLKFKKQNKTELILFSILHNTLLSTLTFLVWVSSWSRPFHIGVALVPSMPMLCHVGQWLVLSTPPLTSWNTFCLPGSPRLGPAQSSFSCPRVCNCLPSKNPWFLSLECSLKPKSGC